MDGVLIVGVHHGKHVMYWVEGITCKLFNAAPSLYVDVTGWLNDTVMCVPVTAI